MNSLLAEEKQGNLLPLLDAALRKVGAKSARREAEWMMQKLVECSRAQLYAYPDRKVAREAREKLSEWVARRRNGEPLQYILGETFFFGLQIAVNAAVLIPRPETEVLVDEALATLPAEGTPRILDVGTGSGCIAIAMAAERPDAEVWACDISTEALAVAEENAEQNQVEVNFFEGNISDDDLDVFPAELDLLVSNPPYIPSGERDSLPKEVKAFEPDEALFCGDDPLRFYRDLSAKGLHLLNPEAKMALEAHAPQSGALRAYLEEAGWIDVQVKADLADRGRVVLATRPPA